MLTLLCDEPFDEDFPTLKFLRIDFQESMTLDDRRRGSVSSIILLMLLMVLSVVIDFLSWAVISLRALAFSWLLCSWRALIALFFFFRMALDVCERLLLALLGFEAHRLSSVAHLWTAVWKLLIMVSESSISARGAK